MEIAFDDNELLLGLFLQGYSVKEIYSLGEFILRENGDYKNLESFQNSTESNKRGIKRRFIIITQRECGYFVASSKLSARIFLNHACFHLYYSLVISIDLIVNHLISLLVYTQKKPTFLIRKKVLFDAYTRVIVFLVIVVKWS